MASANTVSDIKNIKQLVDHGTKSTSPSHASKSTIASLEQLLYLIPYMVIQYACSVE